MSTIIARRLSGRPPLAADRDAREILLDAAVSLFAEQGVAATRSTEIAQRAGLTPAMVHYYFRSREQMLDAVVDERLARFAARVFDAPMPNSAEPMVTTIVSRLFQAARAMPWMPPIWIREIVSEGGALRERMLRHFPVEAVTALAKVIADEQAQGRIPAGIEPRLAFLSIAGATMLPLAVRPLWGKLPGLGDVTEDQLERHAATLLTMGLVPASGGESR
jgi:TetR/AcrR family transcriptional regulator